jgi:hypothetical protein
VRSISRSRFIQRLRSRPRLDYREHLAALRAELAATTKALSRVTAERDKLRRAYPQLREKRS